jgi:hypothetical protein
MKSAARNVPVIAALALAVVLGLATQAQAANLGIGLMDELGNSFACNDNESCDAANTITGVLTVNTTSAPLGTATYSVTASITPGPLDLFLQYGFTGPSTGYLFIVSSDNLTGSNLVWNGTFEGTQTVPFGGPDTTTFGFFVDLCAASFEGAAFSGACTTSPPFSDTPGVPGFSLTEVVEISNLAGDEPSATGTSQFTATVAAVPEPGTLLLLGSGLAVAGMWGRRTFRDRQR